MKRSHYILCWAGVVLLNSLIIAIAGWMDGDVGPFPIVAVTAIVPGLLVLARDARSAGDTACVSRRWRWVFPVYGLLAMLTLVAVLVDGLG